jgi:hypothetical protein
MQNNTAGLFGGLLIGVALLAAYAWVTGALPTALGLITTGGSTPSTSAGDGVPDPAASSFGTYSSLPTTIPTTQPYQMAVDPLNGVTIQPASSLEIEGATIPLPQTPSLAPTVPILSYA